MFKEIKDKYACDYVSFDNNLNKSDAWNNVYINARAVIEPNDKVRNVTNEERALLDDIASKCDLSSEVEAKFVGYVRNMKFTKV